MKKGLCLFLALIMLLSFACAEEPAQEEPVQDSVLQETAERVPDLFSLLDCGGESETWIASAVPISDGILLAPVSVLGIPADRLVVSDGTRQWETAVVLPDEAGLFAIVFYKEGDTPSQLGAWPLLPLGYNVSASSCTVRFGDSLGSRINRGVLDAEEIHWQGQRCYLLSLTDPAPAGSPLLTADGWLAGIVAAEWAEGINRVLVVPAEEIARGVTGVAGLLSGMPEWAEAPEGLTVTMKKNTAIIDWSAMALPETKEGEDVYIVLVDTGNNYLTSFPADQEDKRLVEVLTPGRFYIVGPVVSAGRPQEVPASYASVYVPQAERLTAHNFKPVVTAIAEATLESLDAGNEPVPVTEVTEELLRSDRSWFYSHSTYEVVTVDSDRSLLVTLTDPNGNNYRYESSWVYSPDYMKKDVWYVQLKATGLTESLNESGYPAGVYRVAFYVDGDLADEFVFELK